MRSTDTGSTTIEITPSEMINGGMTSGDYGLMILVYGLDYAGARESVVTDQIDTSKLPGGKLTITL